MKFHVPLRTIAISPNQGVAHFFTKNLVRLAAIAQALRRELSGDFAAVLDLFEQSVGRPLPMDQISGERGGTFCGHYSWARSCVIIAAMGILRL
jgi:hypothetical protein